MSRAPGLLERCDLQCVADGREAVDYFRGVGEYADRERYPAPDLVLLDERMTRMDGSEALTEIKAADSGFEVPVCMLSTSVQGRWKRLCYSRGAAFCIEKPMDFHALGLKLRLIVDFFTEVVELA